jgi:hypothetical protein
MKKLKKIAKAVLPSAIIKLIIVIRYHYIRNFSHYRKFRKLWKEKHSKNNAVVVIGSSQSLFFTGNEELYYIPLDPFIKDAYFGNDKLENFCVWHLIAATAYGLRKKGSQSAAREKVEKLLNSKMLNKNARILCCFGTVDLRVHVLKQAELQKTSVENVVDQTINNYIEFLLFLKKQGLGVFVWAPIPSQIDDPEINSKLPCYGSEIDRNRATEIFNKKLEACCRNSGIGFISIFRHLINDDYTTKREFMISDGVHLSQKAWIFAKPELEKAFL